MDIFSELTEKMRLYSKFDEAKTITDSVPCNGIGKMKLRDHLMEIGTILEFDEESGIFVATIPAGLGGKNPAVVGLMLREEMLYAIAYAKEGLFHQGTAQKAIERVLALFA